MSFYDILANVGWLGLIGVCAVVGLGFIMGAWIEYAFSGIIRLRLMVAVGIFLLMCATCVVLVFHSPLVINIRTVK